jgi:Tfp pilus assembly protein PilE
MRRQGHLTDESGFALLEAIVAAALLGVMVIAVFTTFDTVNRVSGQTKARATAASIAQREQEYMRVLPVSQLSTIADKTTPTTSTETIDNIKYTITRSAQWMSDTTQSASCTADPNRPGDYLKIVSTVSAPAAAGVKPVRLSSVVSPPAGSFGPGQGSLAVTVLKANGNGQPNVAVTLSNGVSRTTDSKGCAFFGYQKVGAYTVVPFAVGMVDPNGATNPVQPVNITPETISTASMQYDVAGTRNVVFKTQALDATTGALTTSIVDAKARIITVAPPGSTATARTFGDGTTRVDKIVADKLFPFTSNYTIYAGTPACTTNNPSPGVAALAPRPAAPAAELATGTADVQVLMPALAFTPVLPSGTSTTPVSGASIILTPKGTGCAGAFQLGGAGAVTNSKGLLAGAGTTAVPFGTYDYCVKDAGNHTVKGTVTVDSTKAAGAAVTLAPLSSTTTATCPTPS